MVRVIVRAPVGLPPARALTGEVQSQERQGPDGLPWRQLRELAAVEPLFRARLFRGRLYRLLVARPKDLERSPALVVRPNELALRLG